jgi:hypothetical protein
LAVSSIFERCVPGRSSANSKANRSASCLFDGTSADDGVGLLLPALASRSSVALLRQSFAIFATIRRAYGRICAGRGPFQ